MAGQTDMELIKNGIRMDGRKPDELREIKIVAVKKYLDRKMELLEILRPPKGCREKKFGKISVFS